MSSLFLSSADLESIFAQAGPDSLLDELIMRLRAAFRRLDSGAAQIPPRSGLSYRSPGLGLLEWMPASLGEGSATLKVVGYHPSNPALRGLPTVISSIGQFDTSTGHLKGMLDGTLLTAMRTGAMSAIASGALARPDSDTLGIVGCGAQAVTQAHALSRLFPLSRIIAFDTDPAAMGSLRRRLGFLDIPVETVDRAQLPELLERSDILCTCTSAEPGAGPLFPDFRNRSHLHINAVGSDFHDKIELPVELLRRAFVCPDFRDQAMREGECQQLAPSEIGPELADVLKSESRFASRQNELTVFDSTGHALADYIATEMILDHANRMGIGSAIELECLPRDPKNPYSFGAGSTFERLQAGRNASLGAT